MENNGGDLKSNGAKPADREVRVVFVDDNKLLHPQFAMQVTKLPNVDCLPCLSSGAEALQKLPDQKPHLVFMDLFLGDMNGLDCAQKLEVLIPGVKILVFLPHGGVARIVTDRGGYAPPPRLAGRQNSRVILPPLFMNASLRKWWMPSGDS